MSAQNALNYFPCNLLGANTGTGSCFVDFKNIVGAAIVPRGTVFSQGNTATPSAFLAALVAATVAVKGSRLFPIHQFAEIKDGSEAAVTEKLGYGSELVVRDGSYKWQFRVISGGFCLSQALRAFNQMAVDVFFIDASGLFIGQRLVSPTGVVTFGGIPQYQIYQEPVKINDGAKNSQYMQNFSFPGNSFDSFGGVQLGESDFDQQVLGLFNVKLFSGGARVTNVSLIKGIAGCPGTDLYASYGTALNVATLWRLQDSVTGNNYDPATGITSVAGSAVTGIYTLTANTADAAYVAGNPVNISLAPASVLDAAGLHIESNTFTTPN